MSIRSFRSPLALFVVPALLAACAAPPSGGQDDELVAGGMGLSASEAAAVLDLVNYPGTDLTVLDVAAGLDSRAAKNILAHRNGADGVSPSVDDDPFDTIEELDAIGYVGDSALAKLKDYAVANPAPAGELVETVAFKGWEVESVLWAANHLTAADMKATGMTSTTAANVVAHAPYATVRAIGAVSGVGPASLGGLRSHAASFWTAMHGTSTMAGLYDGVSFDAATAETALMIAQFATLEQLTAAGVTSASAKDIVSARPFTTLAGVSATTGVGAATMQKLHAYAVSGTWTTPVVHEPGAGAGCLWDIPATTVPAVLAYATDIDNYDPRAPMYHFGLKAYSVPACWDMMPDTSAFDQLIVTSSEWQHVLTDAPDALTYDKVIDGPASFRSLLDTTLQRMDEIRQDGGGQARFDALSADYSTLAALTNADPGRTMSFSAHVEADECSESAAIFFDKVTRVAIVVHIPPSC